MISRRKSALSSRSFGKFSHDINPDEIFLDAKNLPGFDKDQFEGRIEKPIEMTAIFGVAIVFLLIEIVFFAKAISLQVVHGSEYLAKSENNRLDHTPIFAMRGVIYDRNGEKLAWNTFQEELSLSTASTTPKISFPKRSYTTTPGFGHTLGYVSYPKRDSKGYYYQEVLTGKDGLEEKYNEILSGKNGLQISETDARGTTQSGSIVEAPQNGASLELGVDARVQGKMYDTIKAVIEDRGFMAGAGAIMDVETGEFLALTSYPEYDSTIVSDGTNKKAIQAYQLDKRGVFLDRTVSGVYTPGSIVKPMMAIAALNEGIISPEKQILSTGSISIPNPYNPKLKTVFNDWKAHGWVDMRDAIAVSSDVYFYVIGGGFEGQKGMGIANIEKYARMFGFGSATGIDLEGEKKGTIPSPEWKAKVFDGEPWRIGNTYHTVIGQYGFQTTLVQAIRMTASIANDGTLVTPHLVREPAPKLETSEIDIPDEYFQVAREGMRQAVSAGTVAGLNVGYVEVAGKTGTAEIDAGKKYVNSWVVGFFPYDKPKYAFTIVMERGPHDNTIGGVFVMRQMLDWMHANTPEHLE
jgi:penicillin-binding protein 2